MMGVMSGANWASSELGVCQKESVAPFRNFLSLNILYWGWLRIKSAICVWPMYIARSRASRSFGLSVF